MIAFFKILASVFILLLFTASHSFDMDAQKEQNDESLNFRKKTKRRIVLLGASIGKSWSIPSLSGRIKNNRYIFEYIHGGGFDKSKKLRETISHGENKPDAIFLKQCAAYFPSDLKLYKNLMKQWIKECLESGIIPIPTTVVPVTRLHSFKQFLIDILRRRNPFRFGNLFKNWRNKAILEFNDWIRKYCINKRLSILDLEAALRYSEKNRYLREDLAKLDGLHINEKAYKILDKIVIPTLDAIKWESEKCL